MGKNRITIHPFCCHTAFSFSTVAIWSGDGKKKTNLNLSVSAAAHCVRACVCACAHVCVCAHVTETSLKELECFHDNICWGW